MKLKKMVLKNFRQFYGEQVIDFNTSEESNVIVIHGENGAGKTTILEAFSWCMYGKLNLVQEQNILNERVFQENNKSVNKAIIILIFEDRNKEYKLTRSVTVKNVNGKQYYTKNDQTFHVLIDGKENNSNPNTTIDMIMNKKLKEYFFFDGERINNLAMPEFSEEIENGIKNIMGISMYENGIKHLKEAKKILTEELKNVTPNKKESPYEKENQIQTKLDDVKIRLKNQEQRKIEKEKEKNLIHQELEKIKELETLEKERELNNLELDKLKEELKIKELKEKKHISQTAYLAISSDLIKDTDKYLNDKRDKGELPSGIREQFIQDLINNGTCICGTNLKNNDIHLIHLKKLLNSTIKKNVEDGFMKTYAFTKNNLDLDIKLNIFLKESMINKDKINKRIYTTSGKIDDLNLKIKNTAHGSSLEYVKKRENIEETIEETIEKIGIYKNDIKRYESILESIKKDINKFQIQNKQMQIAEERIQLCQKAIYKMEDINTELTSKVRNKLSQKVAEIFSSIIIGKEAKINEKFQLIISKEINGKLIPTATSTGENQIAGLAFISSLVNIAKDWDIEGKHDYLTGAGIYPVVMDSPFGALDETNRDLISKHVQELAPQVITFVSTSQWSKEVENNLVPYIRHQYILQYHTPKHEEYKKQQRHIIVNEKRYDLTQKSEFEYTNIVKVR